MQPLDTKQSIYVVSELSVSLDLDRLPYYGSCDHVTREQRINVLAEELTEFFLGKQTQEPKEVPKKKEIVGEDEKEMLGKELVFSMETTERILKNAADEGSLKTIKEIGLDNVDSLIAKEIMCRACKRGHLDTVKYLVGTKGVDPSCMRNNAIVSAAENGHHKVVNFLIKYSEDGRKPVDPTVEENLALQRAVLRGHVKVVSVLLEDSRVKNAGINNSLVIPSQYNRLEILEMLLREGADPSYNNNEAIQLACEYGYLNIVTRLLEDKRCDPSANNNNAIRIACAKGHTKIVDLLLKNNRVDPSASQSCALGDALSIGNIEIVIMLLNDRRVDPSADNNYAIKYTSAGGYINVVSLLLKDSRVDPSASDNSAIQTASYNGHARVVELLMKDPRVDPSAVNTYSLLWSLSKGYFDVVELLLQDKRVDPTVHDNCCIRIASSKGCVPLVKKLLADPRVNPFVANSTPLRKARENGHTEVVKLLLEAQEKQTNIYENVQIQIQERKDEPQERTNIDVEEKENIEEKIIFDQSRDDSSRVVITSRRVSETEAEYIFTKTIGTNTTTLKFLGTIDLPMSEIILLLQKAKAEEQERLKKQLEEEKKKDILNKLFDI